MTKSLGKIRLVRKILSFPFFILSLLFIAVIIINSCSKPAGLIGVVVQPEDSKLPVFYTDTATVNAYSVTDDTVRTSTMTINIIGSNADPVFGLTRASVYLQFMLEEANYSFGPNPVMDSMVFGLLYSEFYGDTTTQLTFRSYELEEPLYFDSVYYSNTELQTGVTDFSHFSFIPNPSDSVIVGLDTLPPMLRLPMDYNTSLGNKLLSATEDDMSSNENFQEFFKGIYIVADPVGTGGSLISFDIQSNFSEMTLYYHNDTVDSLSFDYMVTPITARVNKYEHDFTHAGDNLRRQLLEDDTLLGAEHVYTQGLAGVATMIKLPNLRNWGKSGQFAVNEAKLVLSGSESDPLWGAPPKLAMAAIQDDGSFAFLADQTDEPEAYFDGNYKSSTNSYTFRITRYVQSFLTDPGKQDNGLYIINAGSAFFPNRFVFDGYQPQGDTARRLKLEVIYTKLY